MLMMSANVLNMRGMDNNIIETKRFFVDVYC